MIKRYDEYLIEQVKEDMERILSFFEAEDALHAIRSEFVDEGPSHLTVAAREVRDYIATTQGAMTQPFHATERDKTIADLSNQLAALSAEVETLREGDEFYRLRWPKIRMEIEAAEQNAAGLRTKEEQAFARLLMRRSHGFD